MKPFFVYMLKCNDGSYYAGHTDDINRRLKEHNDGKSTFTKRHIPWKVFHMETFDTEYESIKREKYLKSAAGRRWMKKNLFSNMPGW